MTAELYPSGVLDAAAPVEETLASAADGATVVSISYDEDRSRVYQYRRAGAVVAEAPTLRLLAELLTELD